jgi:hypothetical protein
MLTRASEPKLMDLGLAKGPVDLGLTQHGTTVGTPQFISPEQAQDPRRADTRSDIYSLGATLYAMLTGRPPFQGTTLAEVLTKVLYSVPTPPRVHNRKVSPEVGYLVERMMLKDPSLRYRTPAEVVHDIDRITAGRSIIPRGFAGSWEGYLLRRRIRRWTKIAAVAAAAAVLVGVGVTWTMRRQALEERRGDARRTLESALQETVPVSQDDALSLELKLRQVEDAVERVGDVRPAGYDDLVRRQAVLRTQVSNLRELKTLSADLAWLQRDGNYAEAHRRLALLRDRIPVETPARRAVESTMADVRVASLAELNRRVTGMRSERGRSLEDLRTKWEAHRDLLERGGFLAEPTDPQAREAREDAEDAARALERIQKEAVAFRDDFAAEHLAPLLSGLELARVKADLERRRRDLLETVAREWRDPEARGAAPVEVVSEHVAALIAEVERGVDAAVLRRWKAVEADARRLRREGRTQECLDLLWSFADAADAGKYHEARDEALALWGRTVEARDQEVKDASARLANLEKDVLELLAAGQGAPIRARAREALADLDPHWPFRAQVEALPRLADALDALYAEALAGAARRQRLDRVRLKDGTEERRWVVVDFDTAHATLTVRGPRGGAPQVRTLSEVEGLQLAEWARQDGEPLPPLVEGVALLTALPEAEPRDLRPLLDLLRRIDHALRDAGYGGLPVGWVQRRMEETTMRQRRREDLARAGYQAAQFYFQRREYESAYHHLDELLRDNAEGALSDAYQQTEQDIRRLYAKVEAELKNRSLAKILPGARISIPEGAAPGTVSVLIDFESPVQLEIFRRDPGRGYGVIEPYVGRQISPEALNARLHLLRGMEDLQRDRPLAMLNVFDPAEPITVEFDLYVLDSPFFFAVDVDGLQTGVLSADPTSSAYRERWRFPGPAPQDTKVGPSPRLPWYGRGRGVAFHAGGGFGDPATWDWPVAGQGRNFEDWEPGARRKPLPDDLFAFYPRNEAYRVKVERVGGRLALSVDGHPVAWAERAEWASRGNASDRNRDIRGGTGLIQILTWTPQAIDNLRVTGVALERYR